MPRIQTLSATLAVLALAAVALWAAADRPPAQASSPVAVASPPVPAASPADRAAPPPAARPESQASPAAAAPPAARAEPSAAAGDPAVSDDAQPAADPDAIPAPDFELPTRSGEPFRLSDHRGEVVVLNLWATWCPPCRREMPDFVALHNELSGQGLTVVGVALDDDWDAVGPFADALDVTYPIAVDDGTVDGLYGPTVSFPTTFVIDRAGNVRHYLPGMILRPDLEPLLTELLAEPAPSS
ncbi:TlpA family protein disulfide reductase [Rubrivirga sp. IMCC45206]|uniref:TlpA family protein disulfide reductase n=1 Tax=Rubrivirga sp. IMCC45206 TaxID=3391614 RepID=UPI00398F9B07